MRLILFFALLIVLSTSQAQNNLHQYDLKYWGEFESLDTLYNIGYALKFEAQLDSIIFNYFYFPDSWIYGDGLKSSPGLSCIQKNGRWKVYTDYHIQIDSVYLAPFDSLKNPMVVIESSAELSNHLNSCNCGFSSSETEIHVLNTDSNRCEANFHSKSYFLWYAYEDESAGYTRTCSIDFKITTDGIQISNFKDELEGNDEEGRTCEMPEPGFYLWAGSKFEKIKWK